MFNPADSRKHFSRASKTDGVVKSQKTPISVIREKA